MVDDTSRPPASEQDPLWPPGVVDAVVALWRSLAQHEGHWMPWDPERTCALHGVTWEACRPYLQMLTAVASAERDRRTAQEASHA